MKLVRNIFNNRKISHSYDHHQWVLAETEEEENTLLDKYWAGIEKYHPDDKVVAKYTKDSVAYFHSIKYVDFEHLKYSSKNRVIMVAPSFLFKDKHGMRYMHESFVNNRVASYDDDNKPTNPSVYAIVEGKVYFSKALLDSTDGLEEIELEFIF